MKRLLLPLALTGLTTVLTACPGGGTPDNSVNPTLIQGGVTGATFPSGSALLANSSDLSTANTGTFTSPDQLNLVLNSAPESEFTFGLLNGCNFSGTATTNPNVSLFTDVELFSKDGDLLGYVVQHVTSGGSLNNSIVARMYSDTAATVKGYWAGPKSWTVSSRDSAQEKGTTTRNNPHPGEGLTVTFAAL